MRRVGIFFRFDSRVDGGEDGWLCGRDEYGDGTDDAVEWVDDGICQGRFRFGGVDGDVCGVAARDREWREVAGGELEGVEEFSGTLGIKIVGGDAGDDVREGELEGGAVLDDGQGEWQKAGIVDLVEALRADSAGGDVVVAEEVAAQGCDSATLARGSDVAALEAGLGLLGR
jgi:hypothetical protein